MSDPRISVILPSYNHCAYVKEAFISIVEQSLASEFYELIIIDDGSTDGSQDVIAELVSTYKHKIDITYVTQSNIGVSATANKGIGLAKGDYIVFIGSDDRKLPEALEIYLKIFEQDEPEADVVYTNGYIIDSAGVRKGPYSRIYPFPVFPPLKHEAYVRNCISGLGMMYRKRVFLDLDGFDENLQLEDWDLLLRMVDKFKVVGNKGYYTFEYRLHTNNTINNLVLMKENKIKMRGKHPGVYSFFLFKEALKSGSVRDTFRNMSLFNLYLLLRLVTAQLQIKFHSLF